MARKRVAIVGSGCSGLGALWALKSTQHDVHLFEADNCLGGHTNTAKFTHVGREVDVDTGFIVFNSATYPNFIKFLKTLGVDSVPTDMTFGVSRDNGDFEWAGTSIRSIFAQPRNILSPRMWRMILDIVRFNQYALDLLHHEEESEGNPATTKGLTNGTTKSGKPPHTESIGHYLEREGYSDAFRDDYLLPMTASVWSTGADKCALEFPALTLVRFLWNHHLLSTVAARPTWMTIPGGSQKYIDAVMRDFPKHKVHLSCPVTSVEDINGKVILQFENNDEELFDHVILACHGDQALSIVGDSGTEEERSILSAFQTTENTVYLHSDISLMPHRRIAWSSWNYLTTTPLSSSSTPETVSLTYNMNILQHIPAAEYGDVLVTMNPPHPPSPKSIQATYTYHHPLYTTAAIAAQRKLPRIQNKRGISYAGAWTKYGFHEDGFSSGIAVATAHLGAVLPWEFVDSTFSRGRRPQLGIADYVVRVLLWVIDVYGWILGFGIWAFVVWWVVVTLPVTLTVEGMIKVRKAAGL